MENAVLFRSLALKTMRLTFTQMLLSALLMSIVYAREGRTQELLNQKITLSNSPRTIKSVFSEVEKVAGVKFIYSSNILNPNQKVSFAVKNETVTTVLGKILTPLNLRFEVSDKQIIITPIPVSNEPPQSSSVSGAANENIVKGSVTDEKGEGLPGVNILIKGSQVGTVTDVKGDFAITLRNETDVLVFSYVGYLSQEIVAGNRNTLKIVLVADQKSLEEVVVVGYGVQRKADVTGAIATISEKELREVPVTTAQQMLQGRAAGVYVVQDSNKPGAGASVQIRGRRSFSAGNDPLYVIDGIPITGGFNDINPNDIASIDILKDASATAIYGSRGANGVVLVTTKRGQAGKVSVAYNNYLGGSAISRYANMMTGAEFAAYRREASRGAGQYNEANPSETDKYLFEDVEQRSIANGLSTDYQRMVVKKGFTQNHDLSVSGGTETTHFNLSLGYFRDKGIIPGQDFTRYTTRVNIDQEIGKRFKIGTSTLGVYSIQNGADLNPYVLSLTLNPLGIPYDEEGNIIFRPTSEPSWSNPMAEFVPGANINENKRFRLLTSLYGEAEILDGLKFRTNFGPDLAKGSIGNFRGSQTLARLGGDPNAWINQESVFNYTWENILTYQKKLKEKHNLNITGLHSIQSRVQDNFSANVQGLPVETMEFYNLGQGGTINSVGSAYSKWVILSYMGRINYSFDDRFLVTATGRFDGSSRFATGHKWGFFPSLALGWNIINEGFLRSSKVISNLKLRMSYGETGNTGIDPYQTQGLLARTVYDFDGKSAYGYRSGTIRNNQLKWETTSSANLGVDFGLFNERLSGSLEVYRSTTRDLLLPRVLPTTSGFESILENIGSTRNTGLELTLSGHIIDPKSKNGFSWTSDLNFFSNTEKILELSQGKVDDIGNARFIGKPLNVYYDYEKTGIWQSGEGDQAGKLSSRVGQIKVNDRNGNGVIDPDDRSILGTNVPKLSGGFTNRFAYKGFDLSIFVFARFGNMIQSGFHQGSIFQLAGRFNNFKVDYWTKDNPTNAYPQPNLSQERPLFASTLTYFNGSFVKIRNINLGYNFPVSVTKALKMERLRVYASLQNPLMFAPYVSKHNGIDPEIPTTDTPLSRLSMLGVNVTF
jgi:TonB-linked SusC/RagA family outer membrane protein